MYSSASLQEEKDPDRTFRNFRALASVDRPNGSSANSGFSDEKESEIIGPTGRACASPESLNAPDRLFHLRSSFRKLRNVDRRCLWSLNVNGSVG